MVKENMNNLELIDCERKGNLIRLYFGKNGEQCGDDWDDVPYEHNAGMVYHEYIKAIMDIVIDFQYEIKEPADDAKNGNSIYCRNDFKDKKIYAFKIILHNQSVTTDIVTIYFGNTLLDIVRILRDIDVDMQVVKIYAFRE